MLLIAPAQEIVDSQAHVHELGIENSDLQLELLSWRKKATVFSLRLASIEEEAKLCRDNLQVLGAEVCS